MDLGVPLVAAPGPRERPFSTAVSTGRGGPQLGKGGLDRLLRGMLAQWRLWSRIPEGFMGTLCGSSCSADHAQSLSSVKFPNSSRYLLVQQQTFRIGKYLQGKQHCDKPIPRVNREGQERNNTLSKNMPMDSSLLFAYRMCILCRKHTGSRSRWRNPLD